MKIWLGYHTKYKSIFAEKTLSKLIEHILCMEYHYDGITYTRKQLEKMGWKFREHKIKENENG